MRFVNTFEDAIFLLGEDGKYFIFIFKNDFYGLRLNIYFALILRR